MKHTIFLISLFSLVSCNSTLGATAESTDAILSPSTLTNTVITVPAETHTLPSESDPNFTVLPSWTALPTISIDTGLQTLYKVLEGGGECLLPCWAGVTPGQSTWYEARHLLEPMSGFVKLNVFLNETCSFGECNEISWSLPSPGDGHGYIYSELPENKIHASIVEITDSNLIKALRLQSILRKYGKPSILLFSTEPDQPGQKYIELLLVYPERQFLIKYSKYAELNGESLESCGADSYIKLVVLDNSEQLTSLSVIANTVETEDFNVDIWHKPVEEAMRITIDTFYETYSKSNAPCITTPLSVWLQ